MANSDLREEITRLNEIIKDKNKIIELQDKHNHNLENKVIDLENQLEEIASDTLSPF
ncbi:hypothetical protein [Peptostreptococcus equinus]|uniref:Uncharacterized protein n=1 Tax=Peptostreptococcus equinus TaxID=3003601 RepID=A0ABY7JRY7_9FIRM|nr:hypothetical protein [Peptostreptococcus sp. CBA3647]WAW14633.1 hypothetical protein O0R46_08520 [Peptostreptococcus sp. CBA3647]WAW15256.1 hypothetical protein O0R46_02055 [Peptostreptococcus sp. CBA3647]